MAKFHITEHGLRVVGATQQDIIEVITSQALAVAPAPGQMSLKMGGVVINNRAATAAAEENNTVYLDIGNAGDASYSVSRVDGDVCVKNDSTGQMVAVLHNAKNLVMGKPN